jgi:hypothetical protein
VLPALRGINPKNMIDTERIETYQRLLEDIRKKKEEISAVANPLIEKLAALSDEEKAIIRLMGGDAITKTITTLGRRSHGEIKNGILSMIDTAEFSVKEICSEMGMDNDTYRSYFSQFYRTHKIGRRGFVSGGAHCYKYATERWYKSQGITDYAIHKRWISEDK